MKEADQLIKTTGMPMTAPIPPEEVLANLQDACSDHPFWLNFRKAAPMLFCALMESNDGIKQVRDISFVEELMKVKSLMAKMVEKINEGDANIDIIEYTTATQNLESKLKVLTALNTTVEGDTDEQLTFNIQGTNKAVRIDLNKMKESITFLDKSVDEKQASAADHLTKVEEIDYKDMTEEEFLEKAKELIGELQKDDKKLLKKDSFIKIFKYSGDFSKMRQKGMKQKAQDSRMEHFDVDFKKYLETLQKCADEEKKAYDDSFNVMFDKLCISQENFERSQQQLMQSDPGAQMETFTIVLGWDKPTIPTPEELTLAKTKELITEANDFSFETIKKEYVDQVLKDPMMMPLLISAIAHDYTYKTHKFTEEQFKAALFEHKIYEDPYIA